MWLCEQPQLVRGIVAALFASLFSLPSFFYIFFALVLLEFFVSLALAFVASWSFRLDFSPYLTSA